VAPTQADWTAAIAPIRSIEATDTDFSDLAPLGESIGDARVVQIDAPGFAEQGASMLAAARLVRYLHAEHDFDMVLFEMGIFEAVRTQGRLRDDVPINAAADAWFRVFRDSDDALATLNVVRDSYSTKRPIEIAGTLSQYHFVGKDRYPEHLEAFFDRVDPSILSPDLRDRLQSQWREPRRLSRAGHDAISGAQELSLDLIDLFDASLPALRREYDGRRLELERRMLVNMHQFTQLERIRRDSTPNDDGAAAVAFRTMAGAENLNWFVNERFAGRKVILWGGFDISRLATTEEVYTLGVTFFSGEIGVVGRTPARAVPMGADSVEDSLRSAGHEFSFLPVSGLSDLDRETLGLLASRMESLDSASIHTPPVRWMEKVDGLLYIESMRPSAPVE
jgi:erythromycin esterase-like protein